MSRNLFAVVGALAALAILLSCPILAVADAQPTVVGAQPGNTTIGIGQVYTANLDSVLASEFGSYVDKAVVQIGSGPAWLKASAYTAKVNDNTYRASDGVFALSGTPTEVGSYNVSLMLLLDTGGSLQPRGSVAWTITVAPPHIVTFVSDPAPTSIQTSAGVSNVQDGAFSVHYGAVMQAPDLQRERHILHRWTDAAGNTYDWSKPVTSDLTLTADWREHFSVSVQGNKVTVTLSPDLPTEYTTHQIDWGDNTVNSELTHLYAATGDYTITVRSGQWGTWASSSTTINIDEVTTVTYTVTFDSAGGSAVPSQTVEKGKTATEPQAPTRQGYNFTGWYLDGKLYDFNTPVTGDLYLSAGWKAVAVDDDKDDDEPANNLLLILLTVLTIISLAITLLTRSPHAFGLTVILALIELALLAGALAGVIA